MKSPLKILSAFSAAAILFSNVVFTVSADEKYDYGEAFQKGIMFYEFQKSGKLPENQRNNWRGDSGMSDGSDVGLDLTGGWYDAGDHVKFNLPMAYTATTLAWSYIEDTDTYKKSGQDTYILDEIRWANDYFIKCHPEKYVYYYQVGNGGADHSFWGSAEIMQMERPSYKVTMDSPGSCVCAGTAASLAAASIVFKDSDKAYSAECLKHAKELFEFAEKTKSDTGYTEANGFYNSYSGFWDELSWAGVWLYMADGNNKTYLNKAKEFSDNWEKVHGGNDFSYKWAQGWDDVHLGTSLLLARMGEGKEYVTNIENNLKYWTTGVNGEKIAYTPKGLAWLDSWGSLRYSASTAFLASLYSDWNGADKALAAECTRFAKSQADYILGSTGRSFLIGCGENYPQHPHHRTAHGAYENNVTGAPDYSRHTLVGALVGGPDANDNYTDSINDYVCNEVACDYNAGLVGLMAEMYKKYGGTVDKNLSEVEQRGDELFVDAAVNTSDSSNTVNFIEVKAVVNNITAWPARVTDKLKLRYFVDISDVIAGGGTPEQFTIASNYSQHAVTASPLKLYIDENGKIYDGIYYTDIDMSGAKLYPGGQSEHKCEIQFRIAAPGKWDFTKSPSYKEIGESGQNSLVRASSMALYDDGTLVFGTEPSGKKPDIKNYVPSSPSVVSSNGENKTSSDGEEPDLKDNDENNISGENTANANTDESLPAGTAAQPVGGSAKTMRVPLAVVIDMAGLAVILAIRIISRHKRSYGDEK